MLTTIFIILLVISQLFCFYIIALLNAKVAKFKDLEIRQNQLMKEMEESISLYLVEIREENDRLIQELSERKQKNSERKPEKVVTLGNTDEAIVDDRKNIDDKSITTLEQKKFVPKAVARNAYNKTKNGHSNIDDIKTVVQNDNKSTIKDQPLSFEQQVLTLRDHGKSIEEIAKMTNKGKTEIELVLKFHA